MALEKEVIIDRTLHDRDGHCDRTINEELFREVGSPYTEPALNGCGNYIEDIYMNTVVASSGSQLGVDLKRSNGVELVLSFLASIEAAINLWIERVLASVRFPASETSVEVVITQSK